MNEKESARFECYSDNCPDCGGTGEFERFYGGGVYPSTIDCERCYGKGRLGNCSNCNGTGVIKSNGIPATEEQCPSCVGVGAVGDCSECGGTGLISDQSSSQCPKCDGFGFSRSK